MRCVKIRDRDEILCLPKDEIEKIEMNPEIQKVPGNHGSACGISWYQGEIVVYYGETEGETNHCCGILWNRPDKGLVGVLADEVLDETEAIFPEEELQKLSEHYNF